jgi:cytidylate kinase
MKNMKRKAQQSGLTIKTDPWMNIKSLLITIDGPAGAGKTTVSKGLAERLSYIYVDTGALYRGVALAASATETDPDNEEALRELCQSLCMNFVEISSGLILRVNGVDVTDRIRTPEITMLASRVSARQAVRDFLLEVQRELGRRKRAVFEGRDMGTVVFPDADVKFFLKADLKERAKRRYEELKDRISITLESVEKDMHLRDQHDTSRDIAPLKPAENAIIIDSTHLSAKQVINRMLKHIQNHF